MAGGDDFLHTQSYVLRMYGQKSSALDFENQDKDSRNRRHSNVVIIMTVT